ncbi:hypothetical protein QIV92_24320 [Raoultella ornithinolytica]|nr:hypothetical protein [Raoultella ornithinolytica]
MKTIPNVNKQLADLMNAIYGTQCNEYACLQHHDLFRKAGYSCFSRQSVRQSFQGKKSGYAMTGIDHQGRYRQGKLRFMVAGLSGQNHLLH